MGGRNWWQRGATLCERAELLRAGQWPEVQQPSARAQVQLANWQRTLALAGTGAPSHAEAFLGLTQTQLMTTLDGRNPRGARKVRQPDWAADLMKRVRRACVPMAYPASAGAKGDAAVFSAFVEVMAPLTRAPRERVRVGLERLGRRHRIGLSHVEAMLWQSVSERLFGSVVRTLTLELNVFRIERKANDDTHAFEAFIASLKHATPFGRLCREYPVLARRLLRILDDWADASLELFERLVGDWPLLVAELGAPPLLGDIAHVELGLSDPHRNGRSVARFEFESAFRLVYKPRSLAVDRQFQALLAWLNERGADPAFKVIAVVDRTTHGWQEFVAEAPCESKEQVERFFLRQGANVALFQALEATDLHAENVIAAGEHPIPVDLESLFHPRIGESVAAGVDHIAARATAHSVLRSALLPQRYPFGESDELDIGALGSMAGQLSPEILTLEAPGSGRMRVTRRRVPMEAGHNEVRWGTTPIRPAEFTESVLLGFERTYRLILEHRRDLLDSGGPLAAFAGVTTRVVARSTQTYARLLDDMNHPDFLRDAVDLDRLLDYLWIGVQERPHLRAFVRAEQDALRTGDVPLFTARPGECAVFTSFGERLPLVLEQSGLAAVRARINAFGEDDLARQRWFVTAAFASTEPRERPATSEYAGFPDADPPAHLAAAREATLPLGAPVSAMFAEKARAIGRQLSELALREQGHAQWLGLHRGPAGRVGVAPLGLDLYDGLPGIALFLATLGSAMEDDAATELARECVASIQRMVERARTHLQPLGAFEGWGGVIFTYSHLGCVWRDATLLRAAEALLVVMEPLISEDRTLDVIGGAAGGLLATLALNHARPSNAALRVARKLGDHLIARARPMPVGLAWETTLPAKAPLLGLSHGAAGIAMALCDLASATGDQKYRDTARSALAYERSHAEAAAPAWPDFRRDTSGPELMGWCHGAPGIGLSRLRMRAILADSGLDTEIDACVAKTLAYHGAGVDHSLCHGDLGRTELLLSASEADDPTIALEQAHAALRTARKDGWFCGTPRRVVVPGFMTGLAGIGYQLLRCALPDRIASVLALEAPRAPSPAIE